MSNKDSCENCGRPFEIGRPYYIDCDTGLEASKYYTCNCFMIDIWVNDFITQIESKNVSPQKKYDLIKEYFTKLYNELNELE